MEERRILYLIEKPCYVRAVTCSITEQHLYTCGRQKPQPPNAPFTSEQEGDHSLFYAARE